MNFISYHHIKLFFFIDKHHKRIHEVYGGQEDPKDDIKPFKLLDPH